MDYKLIITEKAEELLDNLIYHLIYRLKNDQAAVHLLESVGQIYSRLEENPYQFPESRDINLQRLGYREALLSDMDYVIIFRIEETFVYIAGIFHQLENYKKKYNKEKCTAVANIHYSSRRHCNKLFPA